MSSFRDAANGHPPDPLAGFDAAPSFDDALAGFDAADGTTHIPAGTYACTVVRGELTPTKAGKLAYRLALDVADGPHRGHRLWRYFMLDTQAATNRSKAALAPLGLATSAALKGQFPAPGRVVTVAVLVGLQDRPGYGPSNDVLRITVVSEATAAANPFAVNVDAAAAGEGGGA